ncbi:MAG TPA: helix-turn-helix domain-containing protein [Vicinamibacterales bacterium]|nr:helix-turn-helix domain-containing protein [Vicinamibacterales bacterium]
MDQRVPFIADYQRDVFDVAELARRYGIGRKPAYKWLDRYAAGGPAALHDRSRRPLSCPHAIADPIATALFEVRRRHPTWDAKKRLKIVATRHPAWALPARSTVCDLLDRAGLVTARRRRQVPMHPGRPLMPMTAPNGTWTADFKGHFKTRNGVYCYPLPIVDGCSRYLPPAGACCRPQSPWPDQSSSGSFKSTDSRRSCGLTTASRLRPRLWADCRPSPSSGFVSGFCPS